MRSIGSEVADGSPPWLLSLLGIERPAEGAAVEIGGKPFIMKDGILRAQSSHSNTQGQTADVFGYKWSKRDTFDGDGFLAVVRHWLVERYGDLSRAAWWNELRSDPIVLDAGCGAAMSGLALFGSLGKPLRYLGVDVSSAVDMAARRAHGSDLAVGFLQGSLMDLPLPDESVDVVFAEGVLHHLDSTEAALRSVVRVLVPGGRILFYVYRRKGPVREFTDDYIREQMTSFPGEQGWEAMLPLTRLGKALGDLDVTVHVPEDIPMLGIPRGPITIQRLFYWHVVKTFYRPEMSIDEMNHVNYDWFAPANAHRQSPEEVRAWCASLGLEIEREIVEEAGITVIARRSG